MSDITYNDPNAANQAAAGASNASANAAGSGSGWDVNVGGESSNNYGLGNIANLTIGNNLLSGLGKDYSNSGPQTYAMTRNLAKEQFYNSGTTDIERLLSGMGLTSQDMSFLPDYDPTGEGFIRKSSELKQRGLSNVLGQKRKGLGEELLNIGQQTRQAQAKSGFAGSGGIEQANRLGRGQINTQFDNAQQNYRLESERVANDLSQSIYQERQGYLDQLFNMANQIRNARGG